MAAAVRLRALLLLALIGAAAEVPAAVPAVASGFGYSVALGVDGRVRTWGSDENGALGVGRSLYSCPAAVPGAQGITTVAAGVSHALALRADRTVLAWGDNDAGQLGDSSTTRRPTPVAVTGLTNVVEIAAGNGLSMALTSDGRVWEWGYGASSTPRRVEGIDDVVEISAGSGLKLARRRDNTVWAWGDNDEGQLGDGTTTPRAAPGRVEGLADVTAIAAAWGFALALRADGTVWAWGDNGSGSLGDGTTTDRSRPVQVSGLSNIVGIDAGNGFSYAIRNDGVVMGWGRNGQNELGQNNHESRTTPIPLAGITGPARLAAGWMHTLALMPDATLVGWAGNGNAFCQLGNPEVNGLLPARIGGLSGVRAISAGLNFSVALMNDGTVRTFGDNTRGQLGNTVNAFRTTPSVVALEGVEKIASSGYHVTAIKSDGSVVAWGSNYAAAIGDGTDTNRSTPVAVTGLGPGSGVRELSSGARHTLALKADGSVWSWGHNYEFELGTRESSDTTVPARMTGLPIVTAVSAGGGHSLALGPGGQVWSWGNNTYGQLGDGTRTTELYGPASGREAPLPIAGLSDVVVIAAGYRHNVVMKSDGSLWGWGDNRGGQLGDGTRTDRFTPVRIHPGLTDVVAISAGNDFTLARRRDGTLWGWGANVGFAADGVLTQIPGLESITAFDARYQFLAVRSDGSVFAWGYNDLGQIGDGTLVPRPLPAVVLREGGAGSIEGNDWFLDLDPAAANVIAAEKVPTLLAVASASGSGISASVRPRAQDVGTTASTFVFALAPTAIVRRAAGEDVFDPKAVAGKAPVQCELAQLNAQGQLVAVSAASLQAYASGVLSAQGQSVNVLNAVTDPNVAGATFYVGYGSNGEAMLFNGKTRSVVSTPAAAGCQPQPPQTGWWWNPAEGGRGFTIEARGNALFMAAFHYDEQGRPTWNYAGGPTALDGSMFNADFLRASGGQTLTGPYRSPASVGIGRVTLFFSDATHGTMFWPGGSTPIERLPFVPAGLATPVPAEVPEAGWWWNPDESGRGFFVEWQNNNAHIAGYMYDAAGNPTWYLSREPWTDPRRYSGPWQLFGNGQAAGGPYRPAQLIDTNVGALTIDFSSATTGTLTLPDGRRIPLVRQAF